MPDREPKPPTTSQSSSHTLVGKVERVAAALNKFSAAKLLVIGLIAVAAYGVYRVTGALDATNDKLAAILDEHDRRIGNNSDVIANLALQLARDERRRELEPDRER